MSEILRGIFIPFIGTLLGSGCVFLFKGKMNQTVQRIFTGFAAGVMVAASVWSLIIPSIEQAADYKSLAFLPAFIGIWIGFIFLMLLDRIVPHLHLGSNKSEGVESNLKRSTKMLLAVALHNLPEGMAVGVALAGLKSEAAPISSAATLALALGIAIQNFPEGAIVSLPLHTEGMKKHKAFVFGALSGIVEPLGAVITLLLAGIIVPALPYFLSFAAGAMRYVVVEELIPEMSEGEHSHIGTIFFAVGFSVMMVLDVVLG